ncbi:MAG TPA: hypothetical protein VFE60_24540 [Roseiarcus sp.]|jgi:hypothetical protein|nr:hypothetical protein [Roseiarcus sp.]
MITQPTPFGERQGYCVYAYWRPFAPIDVIYIGQGDQRPYSPRRAVREYLGHQ